MIEVRCTSCHSSDIVESENGFFLCQACGTRFILEPREISGLEKTAAFQLEQKKKKENSEYKPDNQFFQRERTQEIEKQKDNNQFSFSEIEKMLKEEKTLKKMEFRQLQEYGHWLVVNFNDYTSYLSGIERSKMLRALGSCHREQVRRMRRTSIAYIFLWIVFLICWYNTFEIPVLSVLFFILSILSLVFMVILMHGIWKIKNTPGCFYNYH